MQSIQAAIPLVSWVDAGELQPTAWGEEQQQSVLPQQKEGRQQSLVVELQLYYSSRHQQSSLPMMLTLPRPHQWALQEARSLSIQSLAFLLLPSPWHLVVQGSFSL